MKWNTIVGTIVLSLGLCSQSFGFDLLNRMLGSNGCGCDNGAKNCCAPGPSCCVKKDCGPKCCVKKCEPILSRFCLKKCCNDCSKGCDKGCADKGCAAPAPTCAAPAPTCEAKHPHKCGCEPVKHDCNKCCKSICRPGLLDRFFACRSHCCKPSCCDKGCADKGCAAPAPTCAAPAPACGCDGGKAPVKAEGEATPPPPAPVVDPSAYIQSTQRRVVQASATLVR
jgi:hypothetical protein